MPGSEMKTATGLQFPLRVRAVRLTLLITLTALWMVVVLAMFPRAGRPASAPGTDRTSPAHGSHALQAPVPV
jgi:hypothetical protein